MEMNKAAARISFVCLMGVLILSGCGEDPEIDVVDVNVEEDTTIDDRVENVQKIFYSIPSPVQTVQLLQNSGATYDPDLVNDPEKFSSYLISEKKMALNLGVFGADLSYNSVFDRTEENMFTFQACDKLAEELSLSEAFDEQLFSRVEENYNYRDSMIDIISDSYWTADDYLRENKRHNVAAMIIVGGWVEGLYIATKMATSGDEAIVHRVAEQKYSLGNLIDLVKSYQTDTELDDLLADLMYLQESFDKVTIDYTSGETTHDHETGITMIGGSNDITISPEVLAEIDERVSEIRNRYIQ